MATTLKICVLGPCQSGKTLLCRALAEQPLPAGEYHPTVAVRVQELSRAIGQEQVKVQLWEVSGRQDYQQHWAVLAQAADGVLLVTNPSKPEQEQELEQLYINFAQPNRLTTKQCMVLALQVDEQGNGAPVNWQGLRGKLCKLQNARVSIVPAAPEQGAGEASQLLEKLFAGCLARKKDQMERALMGEVAA